MFKNTIGFEHKQQPKIGVLITNLGTPDKPDARSLRKYLKQFLSDPRVVEVPRVLWWFVLNGIILNIRPKRSAKAYQTVWNDRGSPLMFHTHDQAEKLAKRFKDSGQENIIVDFAMRYGEPSITKRIDEMLAKGVRKLLVVPLYPQYCAATTASTFDAIAKDFVERRWLPDFRFVSHYHDFPDYIHAVANKIKVHWQQHGQADKLIFSYHGVPKKYLDKGDPYHCECYKTSRLIAEALNLSNDQYITTFQSRFGREEWLKPYTDETLKSLPANGIQSVQVVCPGFSSDCLETIEEIGEENRDYFMQAGGQSYQYIEALNSDEEHINMIYKLALNHLSGWDLSQYDINKTDQEFTKVSQNNTI
ncbi:ferrochelatase [Catenovulum sediminis]|uniref:ferrochelatase n=1 Tax=Catenovulum sediminis TaxID=1740262 RepID=UPI00117CF88A|nr:ferrochelatase [Catenovulum sediminis]